MPNEDRSAYHRAWRAANPDKTKAKDQKSAAVYRSRRLIHQAEMQIRIDQAMAAEVRREHAALNAPEDTDE